MKQKKIYPYIVDEGRLQGYYEELLEKAELVKFGKKKNKNIYDYFLPQIRDYMFWTFNLGVKEGSTEEEFDNLANDLKACICSKYGCNIFQKKDTIIICFETGICFAITDEIKTAKELKKYNDLILLESINLREDMEYSFPSEVTEDNRELNVKNERMYSYILELYKFIYLNKVQKELQIEAKFDRTRNEFVNFSQKIYNLKSTDNNNENKIIKKWDFVLDLEGIYLKVDNEFDLLYKNNKLNYNNNLTKFALTLFIVAIFLLVIDLWTRL